MKDPLPMPHPRATQTLIVRCVNGHGAISVVPRGTELTSPAVTAIVRRTHRRKPHKEDQ